jgi:hypothetical protein
MGMIRTAKANAIAKDAAGARSAGRRTFAAVLNYPSSRPGVTGGIDDWSAMVDEIENEGWQLTHWSVGTDDKGRPEAYPLFRVR